MEDICQYMVPGKRAHLIGIGGVSMSPLAEVLHRAGIDVHGSDIRESDTVKHLEALGIEVSIGHRAENIDGCHYIIRTAAVHDDNPEVAAARANGIPVFERAEAWGAIMKQYQHAVCISGTHGKTTTTSMMTHITMAAALDPTIMVGGNLPLLGTTYRVGHGNTIVLESCEYCNSFLRFFPTVAVILNVEADHLDFFKDLADVEHSFHQFAELVPENGSVIVNADDGGAMDSVRGLAHPVTTFSFADHAADFYAENVMFEKAHTTFDIYHKGGLYAHVTMPVPGRHNVLNALAAAAAAEALGIPGEAVSQGLSTFTGAGRRFEYKGDYHGAAVYDDYAHHPGELKALLDTVKDLGYKRIICAFQPHTYSRTKALFQDFVEVLKGADQALLCEIFAARETDTLGISSRDLANAIPGAVYCASPEEVTEKLREIAEEGDLLLTVGAGDIYRAGERLLQQ